MTRGSGPSRQADHGPRSSDVCRGAAEARGFARIAWTALRPDPFAFAQATLLLETPVALELSSRSSDSRRGCDG